MVSSILFLIIYFYLSIYQLLESVPAKVLKFQASGIWCYLKASACNAGDPGSIPGLGRSPGEENGNPLQYSCLENPMDGGARWATVHKVTKSQTRLSDFTHFTFTFLQSHSLSQRYYISSLLTFCLCLVSIKQSWLSYLLSFQSQVFFHCVSYQPSYFTLLCQIFYA